MKRAFTLIELLVVIAIIGILASVVVVNVGSARIKGRDAKRMSDLQSISTALQLYFDKYGQYPRDNVSGWEKTCKVGQDLNFLVTEGYLPSVPCDPINDSSTDTSDATKHAYFYDADDPSDAVPLEFCLKTLLEKSNTLWYVSSGQYRGGNPSNPVSCVNSS